MTEPVTELDERYGEEGARPRPWEETRRRLEQAELYWISTVRPDGRPHVTPLIAVWRDGALHFSTGAHERKSRNLDRNPCVSFTTGRSDLAGGVDVVLEGRAEPVTDPQTLRALATAWVDKYGQSWHFDVIEGGFGGPNVAGNTVARVFRVAPVTAYAFGKDPYSHTRYRFHAA